MSINTAFRVGIYALAASLALSSCGTTDTPSNDEIVSPIIRAHIDELLGLELTAFEREALGDYWVSDVEWQDATGMFFQCMKDNGLEGDLIVTGQGFGVGTSQADQEKLNETAKITGEDIKDLLVAGNNQALECAKGNVNLLGIPYAIARGNPEGLGYHDSVRRCLHKAGYENSSSWADDDIERIVEDTRLESDQTIVECVLDPSY